MCSFLLPLSWSFLFQIRAEVQYQTQRENRICPAVASDFRLGPVRVPGSLRIQPSFCSYAAACRCGNGKYWLLRDKGLDSSPCWTHPRKARTPSDWREGQKNISLCICYMKRRPFLKISHPIPDFLSPSAVTPPLLNHHSSDPVQRGWGRDLHN